MWRTTLAIVLMIVTVTGAAATIVYNYYSMTPGKELSPELQFWGPTVFFIGVIASLAMTQFETFYMPRVFLDTFQVERAKQITDKEWVIAGAHIRLKKSTRTFKAVYIEVYTKPGVGYKSVERLRATVNWYDKKGLVTTNGGRWWISNVASYSDTYELQVVNLEPNGTRKRLYFAKLEDKEFEAWHRTPDNKEPASPLKGKVYTVEIKLESNNGAPAKFVFYLERKREELTVLQDI